MQTNIETRKMQIAQQFIHPQGLLQNLLLSMNSPCNCGQNAQRNQQAQQQINNEIRSMQTQISGIRSQIVEVQNLLHRRDSLYQQLDQLREERQHIQSEIENSSTSDNIQITKYSSCRQMNDRLRKRIFEVREYIQKMTYQNQKIEQGIISNQYLHQEDNLYLKRPQYQQPVYEGRRMNQTSNFQSLVAKLHDKTDEAWRRVRRQEEDIERRNMNARNRNNNTNAFNNTHLSPKSRTYYSPRREMY